MIRNTKHKHGNRLINLKGMIFGHLLVKKVDVTRSSKKTGEHMANAYWLCRCDLCDCMVSVRSSYLRQGITRMCGDCASAARVRFYLKIKEMERRIWQGDDSQQSSTTMSKKLKIQKVVKGTLPKRISIRPTFGGQNAIKQVRALRDSGMKISGIADLLEISEEEVRKELRNNK